MTEPPQSPSPAAAIDALPPQGRFVLRALARGVEPARLALILCVDEATVEKHLRAAARRIGAAVPPPVAGRDALLSAIQGVLTAAREPPVRAPATRCLPAAVVERLAAAGLDGPLLLAAAEHAADCADCLARVLSAPEEQRTSESAAGRRPRRVLLLALLLVLLLATLVVWVILR